MVTYTTNIKLDSYSQKVNEIKGQNSEILLRNTPLILKQEKGLGRGGWGEPLNKSVLFSLKGERARRRECRSGKWGGKQFLSPASNLFLRLQFSKCIILSTISV